jgi:hypothetical protein
MCKVAQVSEKVSTDRIVDGIIVTNVAKPEYGSIAFEEIAFVMTGSFMNQQKRVAFISAEVEVLQNFVKENNLKVGSKLPGRKIVVKESTEPFYNGQSPKVNPTSGEVVTYNGNPIYRNSYVGSVQELDELLTSDKVVVANSELAAKEELFKI